MSSIEERLERDIAAVTGGVIVTESDLRNARDEVEGRIDSASQRDRRRTVIAASAAAVVVAVAGVAVFQTLGGEDTTAPPVNPAPTAPSDTVDQDADYLTGDAPTPQLIHGVWRVDNGTTLLLFGEDGTIRFDGSGRSTRTRSRPAPTRSTVT